MCYLLLQLRASTLWKLCTALKMHEDCNFLVHLWSKHYSTSALWKNWNEYPFNHCIHSCSCRTLWFLLAIEKVSGPASTAIRQQHVSFMVLSCADFSISWLVINTDNTRQSQYLWPLKHKTNSTRTIHQPNPFKMKNKTEFITWPRKTSNVRRNTELTLNTYFLLKSHKRAFK